MIRKILPSYFRIGEFISELMLRGIIHPDLILENIGFDNGNFKLLDYADVKFFNYPDEINPDRIRQITQSLFPLIRGSEFEDISWLRCGLICRGGNIANIVFDNSINNGLSCFNFLTVDIEIDKYEIKLNDKDILMASSWKKIDFSAIFSHYLILEEFENLSIRKNVEGINKYYFDLYYLVVYYYFFSKKGIAENNLIILLNIGMTAYKHKKVVMAYGMIMKALMYTGKCNIENSHIVLFYKKIVEKIIEENDFLISAIKNIVDETIEYDIPQLIWILESLEIRFA